MKEWSRRDIASEDEVPWRRRRLLLLLVLNLLLKTQLLLVHSDLAIKRRSHAVIDLILTETAIYILTVCVPPVVTGIDTQNDF